MCDWHVFYLHSSVNRWFTCLFIGNVNRIYLQEIKIDMEQKVGKEKTVEKSWLLNRLLL